MINRGSELTHHIELENFWFLRNASRIRLILSQNGHPVVVYDTTDGTDRLMYLDGASELIFRMTEEESLRLSTSFPVDIEIRWQLPQYGSDRVDIDHYDLDPVAVGKILDRRRL